jgi:hypothetical protein
LVGLSFDAEPPSDAEPEPEPVTPVAANPEINEASQVAATQTESVKEAGQSKTSLWVIVALFAAALGVVAVMHPDSEPVPAEPASSERSLPSEPESADKEAVPAASTSVVPIAPVASAASSTSPSASAATKAVVVSPVASSPASAASGKSL